MDKPICVPFATLEKLFSFRGIKDNAIHWKSVCYKCHSSFDFLDNKDLAKEIKRDYSYCPHCQKETIEEKFERDYLSIVSSGHTKLDMDGFEVFYRATVFPYGRMEIPRQSLIFVNHAVKSVVAMRKKMQNCGEDSKTFVEEIDEYLREYPYTDEEKRAHDDADRYFNTRPTLTVNSVGVKQVSLKRAQCHNERCFIYGPTLALLLDSYFKLSFEEWKKFYVVNFSEVPFFGIRPDKPAYIIVHPNLWDAISTWCKCFNVELSDIQSDHLIKFLKVQSFNEKVKEKKEKREVNSRKNLQDEIFALRKKIEGLIKFRDNTQRAYEHEYSESQNNSQRAKQFISELEITDYQIKIKKDILSQRERTLEDLDSTFDPAMDDHGAFFRGKISQKDKVEVLLASDLKKSQNILREMNKNNLAMRRLGNSPNDKEKFAKLLIINNYLKIHHDFLKDMIEIYNRKIEILTRTVEEYKYFTPSLDFKEEEQYFYPAIDYQKKKCKPRRKKEKFYLALEYLDEEDEEDVFYPAMESEQGEAVNMFEEAENTAIATTAIETPVILQQSPPDVSFTQQIYSDQEREFSVLTDRWLLLGQIPLNASTAANTVLAQYHLPADFITRNWEQPNMLPFKTHRFFVGGMELKFQMNINKTNQFACKAGVVYQYLNRDRAEELVNLWSLSQQPNSTLIGPKQNSDELTIPYFSHLPVMQVRPNLDSLNMYYATVNVLSYTDFQVATGGTATGLINVYARFTRDLRFFAQDPVNNSVPDFTPQSVLEAPVEVFEPAMFSAIAAGVGSSVVKAANSVVSTTLKKATGVINNKVEGKISQGASSKKGNRDKPTDQSNMALHQRAVPNIASGSGEFAADSFRLNQVASVPHQEFFTGVEKYDSISQIIETFGYVNTIRFPITAAAGTLLAVYSTKPGNNIQNPTGSTWPNDSRQWTPLDHMAAWFYAYQGRTQYKFEFVVDGFKTCRIRVVWRSTTSSAPIAYTESESLYYETFDVGAQLDTASTFEFNTPYIAGSNHTTIREMDGTATLEGTLYVFCEIPINAPQGSVPYIDILVSKRAMPNNFVFSIPRDNCSVSRADNGVLPDLPDPEPPLINWTRSNMFIRFTSFSVGINNLVAYIATITGAATPVTISKTNATNNPRVELVSVGAQIRNANNSYGITAINGPAVLTFSQRFVGGVFDSFVVLINFNSPQGHIVTNISRAAIDDSIMRQIPYPIAVLEYSGASMIPNVIPVLEEFEPAMDNRELTHGAAGLVPEMTVINEALLGESHMDLLTNIRRFERWQSYNTRVEATTSMVRFINMPLNVGYATYRDQVSYSYRNNKIVHLHDAYRFARGSLRYVLKILSDAPGIITTQHLPCIFNYPLNGFNQTVQSEYLLGGLGESVISLQQNNISTVEVPMYLPTNSVLMASYNSAFRLDKVSQGLGELNLYWQGPEANIYVEVMRAVGDDFEFSCFNGFPIRSPRGSGLAGVPPNSTVKIPTFAPAMFSVSNNSIESSVERMARSAELTSQSVMDFLERMGGPKTPGSLTSTLVVQVLHIINNPTVVTFVLVCGQILINLGFLSSQLFAKIDSTLTSAVQSLISFCPASSNVSDDIDEVANLSSALFCAVSSFMGSQVDKVPRSFVDRLTFSASKGAQLNFRLVGYIQNILEFCKKCVLFISSRLFPDSAFTSYLRGQNVTQWLNRSSIMSDPSHWQKINNNPICVQVLYRLVRQGEIILQSLASRSSKSQVFSMVSRSLVDLKKTRDKYAVKAHVPKVKYNPYCFYIHSEETQIGKSNILNDISKAIMAEVNMKIKNRSDCIFTVPESDKWWENYTSQEVIKFDDFNRIKDHAESADSDCARLCGLKGAAAFDIPKAFEDKGVQSVAKLVACASNQGYPTVNGIDSRIIWSRRNSLYKVRSDFTNFKACSFHKVFFFGCSSCKVLHSESFYNRNMHLRFVRMDPNTPNETWSKEMDFNAFLRDILIDAKQYFEVEDREYITKISKEKEFSQDKYWMNELIPDFVVNDFAALVTDEFFDEVSNTLSTGSSNLILRGNQLFVEDQQGLEMQVFDQAMFGLESIKKVFYRPEKEVEVVEEFVDPDIDDCIHQEILKNLILPVSWKDLGWDVIVNGVKRRITASQCCSVCIWDQLKVAYFTQIYLKYYHLKGVVPKYFPFNHNPQARQIVEDELNQIESEVNEQSWFVKHKDLITNIASALAIVTTIALFLKFFSEGVSKFRSDQARESLMTDVIGDVYCTNMVPDGRFCEGNKEGKDTMLRMPNFSNESEAEFQTRRWEKINPKDKPMDVEASLETSGDHRTRMAKMFSKVKWSRATVKNAKPALDIDNSRMKIDYNNSIVELTAEGADFVARCIRVDRGRYITQLHAICTVFEFIRKRINKVFEERKYCNSKCFSSNVNEKLVHVHCEECIGKTNDECLMIFTCRAKKGGEMSIKVRFCDFFKWNGGTIGVDADCSDMAGFTLDRSDFEGSTIKSHLFSEADGRIDLENVYFFEPGKFDGTRQPVFEKAENIQYLDTLIKYKLKQVLAWAPNAKNDVKMVVHGFKIKSPYRAGFKQSCGSVLMDLTTGKIIGIMSAASNEELVFNMVSSEQLERGFNWYFSSHLKTLDAHGKELTLKEKEGHSLLPDEVTVAKIEGECAPAMRVHLSVKTQIAKSVCFEEFGEVVRAPANLSQDGDKGHKALYSGLSNYVPHRDFPKSLVEEAYMDVNAMFLEHCKPVLATCSKRSTNEAIIGVWGHIPRIPMSTSPGFPWSCSAKTKRKVDLIEFEEEGNVRSMNTDLLNLLIHEEKMMEEGGKPLTIFQISPKDERLLLNKLNNVRLIQGSPLTYTISSRKYLMDFNYAFQHNRDLLQHSVGINVESPEWDSLARKLLAKSSYICVGDYSKFGPRLNNHLVERSYKIMNNWYEKFADPEPQHQMARYMLGQRAINSLNIAFSDVYQVRCGSPSGAINTVIVNSMCNLMYIRIAWMLVMDRYQPKLRGLHHFNELVEFFCYGDDVIFAVDESIISIFNNESISKVFEEYNFKYTDVTKDGKMRQWCSLEEATYLKRGFSLFTETPVPGGMFVCLPSLADVYDTTNWIRKPKGLKDGSDVMKRTEIDAAIENVEDAIRKSWFHGRKVFDTFQNKARSFFERKGLKLPRHYTFEGLQADYGIPLHNYSDRGEVGAYNICYCWSNPENDGDPESECTCKESFGRMSQYGLVTVRNVAPRKAALESTNRHTQSKKLADESSLWSTPYPVGELTDYDVGE